MNKTKRTYLLSLLLSFAVGFTMIFGSAGFAQAASYDKTKAIFEACGDYIYTTVKEPTVGRLTPKETDRQNSRQRMVDYLLANQYEDGGWNILTKAEEKSGYNAVSSVDMTAMGMIALAPYSKQAKVKKDLDRAISYLSE